MLLVIDVGNTNMVFGVFDGDKLIANWRLSTQSGRTADETGLMIRNLFVYSDVSVNDIEAVISKALLFRWSCSSKQSKRLASFVCKQPT